MNLSVIIPSKNVGNLSACLKAIVEHEGIGIDVIVIDDGIEWHRADILPARRIEGMKPFVFARNVNMGINAAGGNDVVILNDDALLCSEGGFQKMQRAAEARGMDLLSASTNVAGNPMQMRHHDGGTRWLNHPTPGNSFPTVAFVCVFIPRTTITKVGLMDERFGGITAEGKKIYGYCDNDYCRRIANAGGKIGVHDGCYVDHGSLKSEFRSEPHDLAAARDIYLKKWGKM